MVGLLKWFLRRSLYSFEFTLPETHRLSSNGHRSLTFLWKWALDSDLTENIRVEQVSLDAGNIKTYIQSCVSDLYSLKHCFLIFFFRLKTSVIYGYIKFPFIFKNRFSYYIWKGSTWDKLIYCMFSGPKVILWHLNAIALDEKTAITTEKMKESSVESSHSIWVQIQTLSLIFRYAVQWNEMCTFYTLSA